MILLCYDGSDDAEAAADLAPQLFRHAPVTVLTVWEPWAQTLAQSSFGPAPVPSVEPIDNAALEQRAQATTEECADRLRHAGMATETRVEEQSASAAETILAVAREIDADAIVVGTRGRSGVKSLLLGSVSHAVVQHADRPVVVVPSAAVVRARTAGRDTGPASQSPGE